jgi:hypothetical protein
MAFLETAGEIFGVGAKTWKLKGIDASFDKEFEGQFIAQGLEESIGSTLGETTTINKEKPDFQWLRGDSEVVSFTTRLFAANSFKNIKQEVNLLKSFTRRNKELKRAPRFLFSAGTEISFTCFVRSIKLRYDELRTDGSLRGAIIDIQLQVIEDLEPENAATSLASQIKFAAGLVSGGAAILSTLRKLVDIPGGSLHTIGKTVTVREGQTFESIAREHYGDALLGDILRRVQPQFANLMPGDKIDLVERSEIIQIAVTPQSVALKNNQSNLTLREERFVARNRPTTIFL